MNATHWVWKMMILWLLAGLTACGGTCERDPLTCEPTAVSRRTVSATLTATPVTHTAGERAPRARATEGAATTAASGTFLKSITAAHETPPTPTAPVEATREGDSQPQATGAAATTAKMTTSNGNEISAPAPVSEYARYFPTALGTLWIYTITLGETTPLAYHEVIWQEDGQTRLAFERRRLSPAEDVQKAPELVLFVSNPNYRTNVSLGNEVQIQVVQDDMGLFEGVEQLSWYVDRSEGIKVVEALQYPDDYVLLPPGQKDMPSFSLRTLFFDHPTDVGRSMFPGSGEDMVLTGVTPELPTGDSEGCPCLHFVRTIEPSGSWSDALDVGIVEETWYGEDIGLIRLEQRIGEQVTMIWSLQQVMQTVP